MKLILFYFILGLFIGFMIIYISASPSVVIKHPNLDNIKSTTYIDDNNVCYRYKKVKVDCSKK